METQKTSNNQSNLEKERWSWRNHATQLQTILQSYNNQDSMVLAQKQECRSVVQDSKPRERNWCTFGHLIYEKGGKNIQFKKSLIHNWCRENWEGACKRMRRIFCISLNLKICLCLYLLCIYYLHVYKWVHICVYTCACVLLKCYLFFYHRINCTLAGNFLIFIIIWIHYAVTLFSTLVKIVIYY